MIEKKQQQQYITLYGIIRLNCWRYCGKRTKMWLKKNYY